MTEIVCIKEPATIYMNKERICQVGYEKIQKLYLKGVLEGREATSDVKALAKVLYTNFKASEKIRGF